MENGGICSSFSSSIAMFIHITAYDLTNCSRSTEPLAASLCKGLWKFCADRASDTLAWPRAKLVLTPRLAPGTHLPTPHSPPFFSLVPRNCQSASGVPRHVALPSVSAEVKSLVTWIDLGLILDMPHILLHYNCIPKMS